MVVAKLLSVPNWKRYSAAPLTGLTVSVGCATTCEPSAGDWSVGGLATKMRNAAVGCPYCDAQPPAPGVSLTRSHCSVYEPGLSPLMLAFSVTLPPLAETVVGMNVR